MYSAILYIFILQSLPVLTFGRIFTESRIVGGSPVTDNGQYLYQVTIYKNGKHSCGGSIIATNKILTAAHCVNTKNKAKFRIYAGITNLNATENLNTQTFTIKTYIVHPMFDAPSLSNDIAIITLDSTIYFDETTNLIRLRPEKVEPDEKLTVSGWGHTSRHSNSSQTLQWVNVRNLKLKACKLLMKKGKHKLGHGNICTAPIIDEGTCKGDSGGPLVDQEYRQVGIVSWGKPCARGRPDIYTSIEYHYKWIMNEL